MLLFWRKNNFIGNFQNLCENILPLLGNFFGRAVKTGFYLSRTFSVFFWRKNNFIANFQNLCGNILSLLGKFFGRAVKTVFYLSRTFSVFFWRKNNFIEKFFRTCAKNFGTSWETFPPKLSKQDSTSLDKYFDSKKYKNEMIVFRFSEKKFREVLQNLDSTFPELSRWIFGDRQLPKKHSKLVRKPFVVSWKLFQPSGQNWTLPI